MVNHKDSTYFSKLKSESVSVYPTIFTFANTVSPMEVLTTSRGNFNIYINSITSEEGTLFHVSFVDNHTTHIVIFRRSLDQWHIVDALNVPDWFSDIRKNIENMLEKEVLIPSAVF